MAIAKKTIGVEKMTIKEKMLNESKELFGLLHDEKHEYEIIGHDCIADEPGMYSVNEAWHTGIFVKIPENATDRQVIKALKDCGYLNKYVRYSSFEISGEYDYSLYINYSTTKRFEPFCELRNVNE